MISCGRCGRYSGKLCALTLFVGAGVLGVFAQPVAGGEPAPCPDGLIQVSAALVPQGTHKDRNGNGLVCAKYQDGTFVGGPDDVADDIIL
jgi:hypothetical protein